MPTVDAVVSCELAPSFRVDQVLGMFDLAAEEKLSRRFAVEVPAFDEDWHIGAIVGPSGSGKSTIARQAFGDAVYAQGDWPAAAVVDGFAAELSIKEITETLTSVGFSSPPAWLRPYHVLSNGEKFRCDLARALTSERPLVVYDEFTSVVDRTVAKVGSAAVAKSIRKGRIQKRFVAVTCHYDVLEWLEPDWVVDMASQQLARRRLRRPQIVLDVAPIHRSAWVLFRPHHYLSGTLMPAAKCFGAYWGETLVGFSAWVRRMTRKREALDFREHRTVVFPDYQGIGIGNRLSETCASIIAGMGGRAFSTTSHPAMIRYRSRSPLWTRHRLGMVNKTGMSGLFVKSLKSRGKLHELNNRTTSASRITAGFQYVGPAMPCEQAEQYFHARPMPMGVSARLAQAEAIVCRWPGSTTARVARLLGLSREVVARELAELVDAGRLVRRGRGGHGDLFAFYPAGAGHRR